MKKYQTMAFPVLMMSILAMALSTGCVRRLPPPPDTEEVTTYTSDRAVVVRRNDGEQRQYYRDDNGKLYYVDTSGSINVIERNVRVERSTAGLYYILDDDNLDYYTDNNGRLYYRDNSGRNVYIEENTTEKVIDPLPILRGEYNPMIQHRRGLEYCNDNWRKCTNRCDDSRGLGSKRTCLGECDYQREQCLQPY